MIAYIFDTYNQTLYIPKHKKNYTMKSARSSHSARNSCVLTYQLNDELEKSAKRRVKREGQRSAGTLTQ